MPNTQLACALLVNKFNIVATMAAVFFLFFYLKMNSDKLQACGNKMCQISKGITKSVTKRPHMNPHKHMHCGKISRQLLSGTGR